MASGRFSVRAVQAIRLSMFALVILCIHQQHVRWQRQQRARNVSAELTAMAQRIFPQTSQLIPPDSSTELTRLVDTAGNVTGYLVRTSPATDHIMGFSGPTDVVLLASADRQVQAVEILASRDTREHVDQVQNDPRFLSAMPGRSLETPDDWLDIDAVSGATLTSLAILESIRHRLALVSGDPVARDASLRFPDPVPLRAVQLLFPDAATVVPPEGTDPAWTVRAATGAVMGTILRTSPAADNITGYQGPTESLIGLRPDDTVAGVVVGESFDNEPYVDYVREDDYFLGLFRDRSLSALADIDLNVEIIEGVSGATMTSLAVTEGIIAAARAESERRERTPPPGAARPKQESLPSAFFNRLQFRDVSTLLILAAGVLIGLTRLRRRRAVRVVYQLLVIGWLGLMNGDLVSMALLLGWAQSGIAWQQATGLSMLCLAALLVPVATGRNLYCARLCPHGAVQQLLRNRLPWRPQLPRRLQTILKSIPALLIAVVVLTGLLHLPLSPVDIEPFDAWLWTVAGPATLAIAVIGLGVSAFVPLAYCRFGCPTGGLLNFLRRPRSRGLTAADFMAAALLVAASVCVLLGDG